MAKLNKVKCLLWIGIIGLLINHHVQAQHKQPQLIDIEKENNGSSPIELTAIGNRLMFTAKTAVYGYEPYMSDGVTAHRLGDFYSSKDGSGANNFVMLEVGGETYAYYFLNDNTDGRSSVLYRTKITSDITQSTTEFVARANPAGGDKGEYMVKIGNELFFAAQHAVNRQELFRNDGTNTSLVKDLNPNSVGGGFTLPSNPKELTNINGILFFSADNSPTYDGVNDSNRELGIRNGSDANTFMIDLNSAGSSRPRHFVERNGLAYFIAEDASGTHLWSSDGSNTTPTQIPFPAEITAFNDNVGLVACGNKLFFAANDKLWAYDGTSFTKMDAPNFPEQLINVNGICFFAASGNNSQGAAVGTELWKSDGTNAGTSLVKDIAAGSFPSSPRYLTVVRGLVDGATKELLYFQAFSGSPGIGLWKSDGTEAGTVRIDVTNLKGGLYSPSLITAVPVDSKKDGYFFVATDASLGVELWYAAPCPSATLSYGSNSICKGDGPVSPNLMGDGGEDVSSGVYSIDKPTLPIDPNTGVITPDANTNAGDYTITYTVNRQGCEVITKAVVKVGSGSGGGGTAPTAKMTTLANGFNFDTTIQPQNDALAGMVTSLDGRYLFVADQRNHLIKKIDLSTNTVSVVAGSGVAGFNDANGTSAQFNYPSGIAIDVSGNLYVADKNNHAIRLISNPLSASPVVTTIAGNSTYPTPAKGNVTGAVAIAKFEEPSGVAVDAAGNIYVVDKNNHRIKKIANGMVTTLAGLVADTSDPLTNPANGRVDGAGGVARFYYPTSLALNLSETHLYITDKLNNLIRKVSTTDGTTVTYAGNIAQDVSGHKDGPVIDAQFKSPAGISVDALGNVYIADTHNQVIRKISGGQVTTIAGTVNTEGDDNNGLANTATFRYPSGIFADLEQNVYISDKLNFAVRKYYLDNANGRVTTGKAICTGTSGTLELKDFGTNTVDKWQSSVNGTDWTDIAGSNGATTINYSNASVTTFYRALLLAGGCGTESSNYAILKIGGPAPPVAGENQTRCGNGNVTVTASGGANGSYVWYDKDGNVDNTQTGDSYTASFTAGTYTVQVAIKGANCESTKVPIQVTVNPIPTPVVDPVGAKNVCPNQSQIYKVTTDNTASGYTYQWEVSNGTIVGSATQAEVTIQWGAPGAGSLKVTESNGATCSATSVDYAVTVGTTGVAPEGVGGSNCGAAAVTLSAKNATGAMQYVWYDAATGGNILKTSTNASDASFTTPSISTTTSYYVSIKNGSCETERVEVVASIFSGNPNDPINGLVTPQTRCGAGEVTFTAEGAVNGQTYRWYDAATGGNLLQDNAVADFKIGVPVGTTTYYVSIHNTACGGESNRVAVSVNVTSTGGTPPNVENREICFGGTAVLGASKADGTPRGLGEEFRWYGQLTGGDYYKNTNGTPKGVSGSYTITNLKKDTTLYVSFYNGTCETERVAVYAKVKVIADPVVIDGSRCGAGSVTLTANGAATGQLYRWYLSSSTSSWLQSSTNNTYQTPNLNIGTMSFYVEIVDPNGNECTSSRVEVKAIVNALGTPPNAPVVRAVPPTLCSAGTFDIEASGATGGQVYKWYADAAKTDLKKTSADHQDNVYTTVTLSAAASYYVSIVDASCGNAESALTQIDVDVSGGLADPVPVAGVGCGAGSVVLSASGGLEGQYRWYSSLTSADILSQSATFPTPDISQTTTYYVSLFNGTCETKRVPVVATIQAAPTAKFDGSSLACINSEVTYTAESTGLQYVWTISSEGTITAGGGTSDNFVTVRWNSGNLGKVSLEEQVGACKANTDKNVSLNPKPTVPVVTGDINEVCAYAIGTTNEAVYSIDTPNPAYTYEWKIVNGDAAGKIVFTNTDATQVRIRWSNSLPTDIFTETFEVVAKAKNTGCTSDLLTQAVKIKRAPIKPLLVDKIDSVYVNTTRTYATTTNNASAGSTYDWQVTGGTIQSQTANQVTIKWNSAAATQALFVKETVTATGCVNYSDTATVYIFPYNIAAKALYPVICEGGQVQLQATDANAGTFAWYTTASGGTAQHQSTNNGSDSDVLKLTQNTVGVYTLYVSPVTLSGVNGADDSGGDNARIAVTFEVKNNDPANFTVVGDTTNAQRCTPNGAGGGAITLTTVSGGLAGAPYTYTWTKEGDASYSADTRDVSDLSPGTYSVQVMDAGGCVSDIKSFVIEDKRQYVTDAELKVVSTGSLALNAVGDTATITAGESLILTATATNAATFAWTASTNADVANISDVASASPTLSPTSTTRYIVQVTNDKGCDTTLAMVVRVLSFEVFVPSMFTPNNDQKNDRFQVFGNQVETLSIKVYNRAGKLIYESHNKDEVMGSNEFGAKTGEMHNNGWDGTYQQKPVPQGNYVWYLRGRFKNGLEIRKSGNVLLVR